MNALLSSYDDAQPMLRAHGETVHARLTSWLTNDPALKLHSITLRLKDCASLAAKLARPDRTSATTTRAADVTASCTWSRG